MADHDVETHTVVFDATVASKEALSRGAREILKGQIEDEDTRADSAAGKQERRRGATFAEIAGEWLSRHGKPNKSRRAVRDDQSMLDRHILPQIGAMRAVEIAKRDIISLLDEVATKPDARKGRAKGSRMTHRPNRVFELLRSIFRWAVGRDLLQVDPTWGLSAPIKKETPRERELAPTEIRQLWQALDRAPVQRRSTKGLTRGERDVGDEDIPMTRAMSGFRYYRVFQRSAVAHTTSTSAKPAAGA